MSARELAGLARLRAGGREVQVPAISTLTPAAPLDGNFDAEDALETFSYVCHSDLLACHFVVEGHDKQGATDTCLRKAGGRMLIQQLTNKYSKLIL